MGDMPHRLTLEERSKLTMTGVQEVVSFDDTAVVLHTALGTLVIQGRELSLKQLSLDGGCPPVWMELSAGNGAGGLVWVSASPPPPADRTGGRFVCAGGGLGLAVPELRDLPGGPAAGVRRRTVPGSHGLGADPGEGPAAGVFWILEGNGCRFSGDFVPSEKIFQKNQRFFQKTLCNLEKMGYNKEKYPPHATAENRRQDPWETTPQNIGWSFAGADR